MRCKPMDFCYNCERGILWIDYEQYGAGEIFINGEWTDACGQCRHEFIYNSVMIWLNNLIDDI